MIQNFENTERLEDKAGNTWKLGNPKLASPPTSLFSCPISLHSPSINYKLYLFESFTLSHFDKMIGTWHPEFVHIHVFMGIHETINNNQEDLKHLICLNFILLIART